MEFSGNHRCPNNSFSANVFRQRATVHRHECERPAGSEVMDGACDQLLAGSCFAPNEHRGGAVAGNAIDRLQQLPKGRRLTDQ
jgi:hypothetical protein